MTSPLVNPGDAAVEYDDVRVYHHTDGEVYALDLVDPSDPDATDFRIAHPTHGKLAVRAFNP